MNTSDRRRSNFLAALLGALAVAVPFSALALGGAFDSSDSTTAGSPATAAAPASPAPAGAPATPARSVTDVSALYARVSAGVVAVEARGGSGAAGGGDGAGSGFVIDTDGFILTNEHVVDGATRVQVRFDDGPAVAARVVGSDASSDLALLKIDADGRKLAPLALGSSEGLKVGQPAIAIGNPYRLDGTLTTGVISALGRTIDAPNRFPIENAIQTDAAINPGNSGGPLLDAEGRVIGVNAQITSSSGANDGVGFAVPIDTAKRLLPQLKRGEEIERPYLGVSTRDSDDRAGAVVGGVVEGGPADDAGLRARDVIVAIGGNRIARSADVARVVTARKPGDRVTLRVRRGGSERTLTARLGTRPASAR